MQKLLSGMRLRLVMRYLCCTSILMAMFVCGACTHPTHALSPEHLQARSPIASIQQDAPPQRDTGPYQGWLTLDRAIEEALKASPELEQMHQRIEAANAQVRQASSAFYPQVTVSEEYIDTNNPVFALMNIINQRRLQTNVDFNHPGTQQNFGSRVKGEWSLFEGGSHWHLRQAALGEMRSNEANLLAARNQLVSKMTETYYHWLEALNFAGVAQQALQSVETNERLGEARIQAAAALPSEHARLKAQTAEANSNLVTAKAKARRLQAAVERLIARRIQPGEVPNTSLSTSMQPQEGEAVDSDVLVKQALASRPEMAGIRSLIKASQNRVYAAQGGLLPKIGASAQYEVDSESLDRSAESWMVGVVATWPLFEGGASLARISEAKAHLKEMRSRGQQVELDIALEVQQAVLTVQEAAEKARVAEDRRVWAKKALDEVRSLYNNQAAGVDSLLQSEVAWNEAEASYSAALFEVKIAQALLRQALGDFAEDLGSRSARSQGGS